MISEELNNALELMREELVIATQQILLRNKVERGADLVNSIDFQWDDTTNTFQLIAFDYFTYLSQGRRPGGRKVPIEDLIRWIKDKRITTTNVNSTAYAIQTAIYKSGIRGRGYVDQVIDVTTDMISEDIAEELSESIVDELAETINKYS